MTIIENAQIVFFDTMLLLSDRSDDYLQIRFSSEPWRKEIMQWT